MTQRKPSIPRTPIIPDAATPRRTFAGRMRIWLAALALIAVCYFVSPYTFLFLARSSLTQRDPQAALYWLSKARWFGPHQGEIEFLRARCFRRMGDLEQFRSSMQAALNQGYPARLLEREQILMLAQVGRLREVEARMPEILVNANEDAGEVCEAYVSGLLLNFQQEQALTVIDSWSKDYPSDPQPELIRAQVLQNAGRFKEAEAAYTQALKRAPSSSEIRLRLGLSLLANQKIDQAKTHFQSLQSDAKYRDTANLQLSRCERMRGDLAKSQASLDQIRDPERLLEGDLELEKGLLALDKGEFEAAVISLERVKPRQPGSLEVGHALARALRGAGRVEQAATEARRVAESQTKLSRADQLQAEIARDPNNLDLRLEIGQILLEHGDPKRGVSWLKSALNLDPNHSRANLALGEYYQSLGPASVENMKLSRMYLERAGLPTRPANDL